MWGFFFLISGLVVCAEASGAGDTRVQQGAEAGAATQKCREGLAQEKPQSRDIGSAVSCLASLAKLRVGQVNYQVSSDGILAIRAEKKRISETDTGKDAYYIFNSRMGRAYYCDWGDKTNPNEPPKLKLDLSFGDQFQKHVSRCRDSGDQNIQPLMQEICSKLPVLSRKYEKAVESRKEAREQVDKIEYDERYRQHLKEGEARRVQESTYNRYYAEALTNCQRVNSKAIQELAQQQNDRLYKTSERVREPGGNDPVNKPVGQ